MRIVLQLLMILFMVAAISCVGVSIIAWLLGHGHAAGEMLWGTFWCVVGAIVCIVVDVLVSVFL